MNEKGKINIERFKGLGEMNPLQLLETTMSRDTRRLVQLTIDDLDATNENMDMLLGKKTCIRPESLVRRKGRFGQGLRLGKLF